MAVEKQITTIEEFEWFIAQPEHRGRSFELINGEIIEKMPTEEHGIIAANVVAEFKFYLKSNPIGRTGVKVRYRVPTDNQNDVIPDVSFISHERALAVTKKGAVPQMPDLVVEIKLPDDTYLQMREKALYYLKNGSRMVVLAFPEKQRIEAHTEDAVKTLDAPDQFDGDDVLPGFTLAVGDIFAL